MSNWGSTGYLFRQPIVADAAGNAFRLDDPLGEEFAIVARKEADRALGAESSALVDRLGISTTSLEGLALRRGRFDPLFDHAAAAIVRPDCYFFGHTTDALPLDALLATLKAKLHLR